MIKRGFILFERNLTKSCIFLDEFNNLSKGWIIDPNIPQREGPWVGNDAEHTNSSVRSSRWKRHEMDS